MTTAITSSSSPAQPKHWDAIVIGAGLSGLASAAFLAKAGARVLVCEQTGQVGGLFNSFQRDGYQFDGGIKAVENSAVMMPALAKMGLLERISFQRSPIALVTAGKVQPIHAFEDVEAYFSLLGNLFPTEQAGLQQIARDTRVVFDLLDAMLCFPIPFFDLPGSGKEARSAWIQARGKDTLARLPRSVAMFNRELRPYLEQHLRHPGLINLLSDLFPDGTSVFFGLGYFRMFLDYYYPKGGVQVIPDTLAGAIQEWGSEIRLRTRVRQVLLRNGRACGVELENGEQILAGHVIAASDLRQALTKLVSPDLLPERFARRFRRAEVSHSVFNVFLGLDIPVERLDLQGCQHIFYHPDLDGINEEDRTRRADYFAHVPQEISVPCLHQPRLAPPGKTGLNTSAMASWHYLGGWERSPAEYEQLKQRCADEMIASLEKWIPGLSEHIEMKIISTPRTIATLTGNSEGAIMGWSYHRERTLPRGNFWQLRSSVQTPLPGLLTAGHWSFSPGGSPVAMLTGIVAAEHVLTHSSD